MGGKREALIPADRSRATTDPDEATRLVAKRLSELERLRRGRAILGLAKEAPFAKYVDHHLKEKRRANQVTDKHLQIARTHLDRAVDYFGRERALDTISVGDVDGFRAWLGTLPGRGGPLSPGTVRHHLNDLSNLFRRAESEGVVPPGHNPVAAMLDKPTARSEEAEWLEVHEAALFLEACRLRKPPTDHDRAPLYEIVATYLLTGGRKREVLGLAVDDVNLERRTVTFRPHSWRRLKTKASRRVVPLWPQLREILSPYIASLPEGTRLLFPSARTGKVIHDIRRPLDSVSKTVDGQEPGSIRTKAFRHTYCASRLQTVDRGAPVSPFTVAREMGHGGTSLVERVYGHLGDVRQRSDVVEYRADDHADQLGDRLKKLREEKLP